MTHGLALPSSPALRALGALLIGSGITYSCVERPTEDEPIDPTVRATLESSAACAMSQADEFLEAARTLHSKVEAWAESPDDADARSEAQDAWTEAMLSWHRTEPMTFGPAGSSSSVDEGGAVGGRDLRDLIYSWPLINSCRIDQAIEVQAYDGDLGAEPINAQGLDAIEYLLFYDAPESSCLATTAIVADGRWDAIDDLMQRRADYATAAASLVRDHANTLKNAWDPEGEDFLASFVQAGENGPFETQTEALNAVIDAIFYVEKLVKDQKLAIPLAISEECTEELCPEDVEHEFSGLSKRSIRENIVGFELILEGCGDDPIGLAGLLVDKGAELDADELRDAVSGVYDALDAIEEDDLIDALAEDPDSVRDLYDAVKVLTDLLKNDLVEILEVNVPSSVGGDND